MEPGKDFSSILDELKAGRKVYRIGWRGQKIHIEIQLPNEDSKMTHPYIFINIPGARRIPWSPNQSDIFAEDWFVK